MSLFLNSSPMGSFEDVNRTVGTRFIQSTKVPLPIPYTDGIRFAQVFDYNVPDKSVLIGTRSVCWGNDHPISGVYTTRYIPFNRANPDIILGGTGPSLTWFKQNHPDWLVYENDRTTLFHLYDYDYGEVYPNYYYVDLDVQNPEVRQYKLDGCLAAIAKGYTGMAFDNVTLGNDGRNVGGIISRCAGHYVNSAYDNNGNRTAGTWVQDYSGTEYNDPLFMQAQLDYMSWMRQHLNAHGIPLMANIDNATVDTESRSKTVRDMLYNCDIWLNEARPVNAESGKMPLDADWLVYYRVTTDYAQNGGVWLNACYSTNRDQNLLSQNEIGWIVGNFLLMKGQQSYLHPGNVSGYTVWNSYFTPNIGHPLGSPFQISTWLFQRNYSNGFVVINPNSTTSFTYIVPSGAWKDQFGNVVVAGSNTIGPASGIVLLPSV